MSRVMYSNCYLWLPVIVLLWDFTNSVPANNPAPPASPCPGLFTYQYDTNRSEYYGQADLQTQTVKNSAEVEMSFTITAQLPSSYVGSIEAIGDNRQLIDQISKGRGVSYRVNLPIQDPLPRLTKLSLNGKVLCTGPSEKGGFVTETNLRHFLRSDSNWQQFNQHKGHNNNNNNNINNNCNNCNKSNNDRTAVSAPQNVPNNFKLVGQREQNHTVEETEQAISPTGNSTSYKYVTKVVTYKEYVSAPLVEKTSHYFVNTTTREQV
ncbi:putative uncharacterized protein DDB_G0279653 [Ochlerotatus camptorhynchus]|uniref:putative uncharacterized protein DDB_G0279653 n=1 Tax=Ochlerotatus camptorhynchus TaxID=644619 RepID=UPI0031DBCBBA